MFSFKPQSFKEQSFRTETTTGMGKRNSKKGLREFASRPPLKAYPWAVLNILSAVNNYNILIHIQTYFDENTDRFLNQNQKLPDGNIFMYRTPILHSQKDPDSVCPYFLKQRKFILQSWICFQTTLNKEPPRGNLFFFFFLKTLKLENLFWGHAWYMKT